MTGRTIRRNAFRLLGVAALSGLCIAPASPASAAGLGKTTMWVNHLDLLAGDPSVITSFNAVNSGVGGGLSGLIINSTTTGEDALGGGNKVVEMAPEIPPGYVIRSVRVCYESTSSGSFISQIRLAQVQDPPATALVLLDDPTDLTDPGPKCVDSGPPFVTVNPSLGSVLLSLRVNFG